MPNHARPQLLLSKKRKERDPDIDGPLAPTKAEPAAPPPPPVGNRLLAGYLAHEFLTKGTLFGQRFDSPSPSPSPKGAREGTSAYADVAMLLKVDGAHVPGVLNPTHLARWIQMTPRDIASGQ